MGCCRQRPLGPVAGARGMMSRRFILPVRVATLVALLAGSLVMVARWGHLTPLAVVSFFMLLVIFFILNLECRRSLEHYRVMDRLGREAKKSSKVKE